MTDTLRTDIADEFAVAKGAALMGYLPPYLGAVGRTLTSKLQEEVSANDFGLSVGGTPAQNDCAMAKAMAYAAAQGGITLTIPRGTYDFSTTIDMSYAQDTRITGDGMDATILRITHPSVDFVAAYLETHNQTIDNLTLTSTVTRTGGAMFRATFWKYSILTRVRITEHCDAIALAGFVQCTLSELIVTKPSGAGAGMVLGTPQAYNTGANLNVTNCFFRGQDDATNSDPVGLYCAILYDIEALFIVNSDIGNFRNQILYVDPMTNCNNCHFVQTFFDGTKYGDHVLVVGNGRKANWQFTGCWFNGAGGMAGGGPDLMSLNLQAGGELYGWNLSGCRFLNNSGCAIYSANPYLDLNITGNFFLNQGFAGGQFHDAIYLEPSAVAGRYPNIVGNKFEGSHGVDIRLGANVRNAVVTGNSMPKGLALAPTRTLLMGGAAGNWDEAALASYVHSGIFVQVSPACNYFVIDGTIPVHVLYPTFPGHIVAFRCASAVPFYDDGAGGNLRLAGNFVGNGSNMLTLMCEANGEWRELSRSAD